jgi:ligand-binding sensor domain-containing protein
MKILADGPWTDDLNTSVNGHFVIDSRHRKVYGVYPYFIAEYDTSTLLPEIIFRENYPDGTRMESDQLKVDVNGNIWIGSVLLRKFNPSSRSMSIVLSHDDRVSSALSDVGPTFIDRTGLIWAGSRGYGVVRYNPSVEQFNNQVDQSIYWIHPVGDKQIVCQSMWRFLRIYDLETHSYVMDIGDNDPRVRSQFPGLMPDTHTAFESDDGLFWMTKGALISYDPKTMKVTHHPILDSTGKEEPWVKGFFPLIEDQKGLLWFGTDTSVYSYDRKLQEFNSYRYPIIPVHTPYRIAQSILPDENGNIWIGSTKGLLQLDPGDSSWTVYQNNPADSNSLSFDLIFSLATDPADQNTIWIGTNGGGLNRFNKSTKKFRRYGTAQGLPNEVVYGILSDDAGNFWMSTNKGICALNPQLLKVTGFQETYSLSSLEPLIVKLGLSFTGYPMSSLSRQRSNNRWSAHWSL